MQIDANNICVIKIENTSIMNYLIQLLDKYYSTFFYLYNPFKCNTKFHYFKTI